MGTKDLHIKPFDLGTLTKLEIFEKYTQAWIPVFAIAKGENIFIVDFFAGTGYDLNGVPESPIRILTCEPLIGPLPTINLNAIDWVIVGGESGHKARPMNPDWVVDIQEQCQAAKVAFLLKQWGGKNKKMEGRELNGQTYDEMPDVELERFI